MNWTTSAILNRLGRAQIKPLYAQVLSPLKGGRISPWLFRALRWWCDFIDMRPTVKREVNSSERPHLLTWADASGVDCIIEAVIYVKTQDRWYHCYMKVPDHIMSQFLAREDHEIQGQELLGVILAYHSFRHVCWLWSVRDRFFCRFEKPV